jgi:hypothetical protein
MRVRAHVRFVAALWLTGQMTAFAAAPFVVCNDHSVMSQMGDGHECGPQHHHHGQPAQPAVGHEHHQQHGTDATTPSKTTPSENAVLDCRCTVSDAALAALLLDSGILPGDIVLGTTLVTTRGVFRDSAAPTRSQHPDTPPPRA